MTVGFPSQSAFNAAECVQCMSSSWIFCNVFAILAKVGLDETHYSDVIMGAMASQITNLTIAYSSIYSGTGQRKHQSSASLALVRGIHRWPGNSTHTWPVTRKLFSFDDVIMGLETAHVLCHLLHGTDVDQIFICHSGVYGCTKSYRVPLLDSRRWYGYDVTKSSSFLLKPLKVDSPSALTCWGPITYMCVREMGHHQFS